MRGSRFSNCKVRSPFLISMLLQLKTVGLTDLPPFYKNPVTVWQEFHFETLA